jgi:hypothetical protein
MRRKRARDFRLPPRAVPGAFRIVRRFLQLGLIGGAERLRGAQGGGAQRSADQSAGGDAFGTRECSEPAADDAAYDTTGERRIGLRELVGDLRSDP